MPMSNLYHDTAAEPAVAAEPLSGRVDGDVIVVGAGFTGLSTALHLAERGKRVIVLEAETPGYGASGRNGGQVNAGLKKNPDLVERQFGELGRRMNAFAGQAPQVVFDLIARHGIRCDARRHGTLRAAITARQAGELRVTAEQLLRRGAPVELLEADAAAAATGTTRYRMVLRDARGGDLNPLSFARGLARAARGAGAAVHGASRVLRLERSGAGWVARTATGSAVAPRVVIATNGYSDGLWPALKRSIVPVFGAIAATQPLPPGLASVVMPGRSVLFEIGAITVYYRVDSGNRLLIGGRGPMREPLAMADVAALRAYASSLWPALRDVAWTHCWGGQLAMTVDQYPHVHEPQPGILICVGYNGRGVALSTALGAELARYIAEPGCPIDMPISSIKAIPLHAFWRWGVRIAIARARLREQLRLA